MRYRTRMILRHPWLWVRRSPSFLAQVASVEAMQAVLETWREGWS